eukprot:12523967-Ditylum_brightwellii.AAC.1
MFVSEVPPFVQQKHAISAMPKALQNAVGATLSVLKRMLHPKKKVAEKYQNMEPQDRLDEEGHQAKRAKVCQGYNRGVRVRTFYLQHFCATPTPRREQG